MFFNKNQNKITQNILDEFIPNNDCYSWKEVNCYHRPLATAFMGYNEDYYDGYLLFAGLLLTNYLKSIECDEEYYHMYDELLRIDFGINILRKKYNTKSKMIDLIKESIDEGCPVITMVDIYQLKSNAMYQKEHSLKFMLIKGYDLERKLFYILDNSHIDQGSSTVLGDYICSFNDMYSMVKEYSKMDKNRSMTLIKIVKEKDITFSKKKMMLKLGKILEMFVNKELNYDIVESKFMETVTEGDIMHICLLSNFKGVFYKSFEKLLDEFSYSKYLYNNYIVLRKQIQEECNSIKTHALYLLSRNASVGVIKDDIINTKKNEFILIKNMINIIYSLKEKRSDNVEELQNVNGFLIKNRKNAKIEYDDKSITVYHQKNIIYDTWTRQDDAVQFLVQYDSAFKYIETCVDYTAEIGQCFSCGIIIKLQGNEKILFGNVSGSNINVFCPFLDDKFEVFNKIEYDKKLNSYFRIEIENGEILFITKAEDLSNNIVICKFKYEKEIQSIGLYSKTWLKIDNSVKFTNYRLG